MHNAHVIQMKVHVAMRPRNMFKLFCLGTAIWIAFAKQEREPMLRKIAAHIEHDWLT